MANPEHLKIVKQGAVAIRGWRKSHPAEQLDLQAARIRNTDLGGADLQEANLVSADLSDSDLSGALFLGAVLHGTTFQRAALAGTVFIGAHLASSVFCDVDLSECEGLDRVNFYGPCSLGVDTLTKSKGTIPKTFLSGCGLADWEIEQAKLYDPDLLPEEIADITTRIHELRASKPFQTRPVLISYSHKDSEFVDRLQDALDSVSIRHWRDIHDSTAGPLEDQVRDAMRDRVVLQVLSANSVESDWVEAEAEWAREVWKDQERYALCPIALDEAWLDCGWPDRLMKQIKKMNVLDFSEWQDETEFAKQWDRLYRGLKKWFT